VIAVIGEVVRGAVGEHEARGREDGAVLIIVGLERANEPERSTMSRGGATKGLDRLLGIEDRASVAVGAIGRVKVLNRNALFAKLRNREIRVLHAGPATNGHLTPKPSQLECSLTNTEMRMRSGSPSTSSHETLILSLRSVSVWPQSAGAATSAVNKSNALLKEKKKKKKKIVMEKKKKKTEKQTKSNLEKIQIFK
jgi:hypothetical protein